MAFYLRPKPSRIVREVGNLFRNDTERAFFELPEDNIDLSAEGAHQTDVEGFLDRVGKCEVLYTNRLHTGIAGILLGRAVHLYRSRASKLMSIFKASIASDYGNATYHVGEPGCRHCDSAE